MVGHTFEYNPAVWKLRELVQSRELGDVYYLDSARLNLGLYQNDVNVILDLAPHDVSIINHVLGRKPVAVQAWASRHAHQHFEDVAYLRLFYDDNFDGHGLSANIHVSWLDPCKVRRVTAVGSTKMAVYDDLAADERIRVLDKGVCPPPVGDDLTQPPMSYRYGDILVPFVAPDEPLGRAGPALHRLHRHRRQSSDRRRERPGRRRGPRGRRDVAAARSSGAAR